MQGGNKMLKAMGDRLIDEKNGRIKCHQHVSSSNLGFRPHTWALEGASTGALGDSNRLITQFPSHCPRSRSLLILQVCSRHWSSSQPLVLLSCCLAQGCDFSNKYVLSTECSPSTIVGMRDSVVNSLKA